MQRAFHKNLDVVRRVGLYVEYAPRPFQQRNQVRYIFRISHCSPQKGPPICQKYDREHGLPVHGRARGQHCDRTPDVLFTNVTHWSRTVSDSLTLSLDSPLSNSMVLTRVRGCRAFGLVCWFKVYRPRCPASLRFSLRYRRLASRSARFHTHISHMTTRWTYPNRWLVRLGPPHVRTQVSNRRGQLRTYGQLQRPARGISG